MDFFIRIRDGQPVDHPIFGDNFRAALPHIDTDNLPPDFARFVRTDPTSIACGTYEELSENYVWDGSLVRDDWRRVAVSPEAKAAKIAGAMAAPHPDGWIFSEENCRWEPDVSGSGSEPDAFS